MIRVASGIGGDVSPEVSAAIVASHAATSTHLRGRASARELIDQGFASDVEMATMPNVSDAAPVLGKGFFSGDSPH